METQVFNRALAVLILCTAVWLSACKKPSYADIKVEEHGAAAQGNREEPKSQSIDPESDLKKLGAPDQGNADQQKGVAMPDFFDSGKGRVKDLPYYPRAVTTNIQIAPVSNTTMLLQVMKTRDSFETVTAFFDQALKTGGWKISSRNKGERLWSWELARDKGKKGAIQVEGQKEQGIVFIVLRRARSATELDKK